MNAPDLLARCAGYAPQLLQGALTTLWLSALAVCCGFFAGIFVYTMSVGKSRGLAGAARVYVSVFRGTPVLAQLLVFYYVPSALGIDLPGVVAAAVGYDSLSQFHREYKRLFGAPPMQDALRLRTERR